MALLLPKVAVEFYSVRAAGGGAPGLVTATPTRGRVTWPAEHGYIDLTATSATPDATTGYGVLLLEATDVAGITETFGWSVKFPEDLTPRRVAVPTAPSPTRTVVVGGTTYPAAWLVDLTTLGGT